MTSHGQPVEKVVLKLLKRVIPRQKKSITIKDIALSREEIDGVIHSNFIKRIEPKRKRDWEHAPEEIRNVLKYVSVSDAMLQPRLLSYSPSPFDIYTDPKVVDSGSSRLSPAILPRLSVTQLLTKSWCELQELFRICTQRRKKTLARMASGHLIHDKLDQGLKEEVSNELARRLDVERLDPTELPTVVFSSEDTQALNVLAQISNLSGLLLIGEAREVYCHSFVNLDNGFVKDPHRHDLLLTGIIDYLTFENDQGQIVQPLKDFNDIRCVDDILNALRLVESGTLSLGVYDIKTRRDHSIPRQASVFESSKNQIQMYEIMLSTLGETSESGMRMMEEYMGRKDIDIDKPLSNEFILYSLASLPFIKEDYTMVQSGAFHLKYNYSMICGDHSHSEMETFDEFCSELPISSKVQEFANENFGALCQSWKSHLTLRHLIIILVELIHCITTLTNKRSLAVKYYKGADDNFQTVRLSQDKASVNALVKTSLAFWYGLREVEPIERNANSYYDKCQHCDFKDYCSWSKGMVEQYVDRRVNSI